MHQGETKCIYHTYKDTTEQDLFGPTVVYTAHRHTLKNTHSHDHAGTRNQMRAHARMILAIRRCCSLQGKNLLRTNIFLRSRQKKKNAVTRTVGVIPRPRSVVLPHLEVPIPNYAIARCAPHQPTSIPGKLWAICVTLQTNPRYKPETSA